MGENQYIKNCYFCAELGSDGGDDYTGCGSFPVCEAMPGRDNLKSFPFKKEQKCHVPDFWRVFSVDSEIKELYEKHDRDKIEKVDEWESWKLFKEKYRPTPYPT